MNRAVDQRCPPSLVDRIVGEVFDPRLLALGFQRATPRKYVRRRVPHTYDVIERLSQTVSLRLIWGLSLDFVPHVGGRQSETVRWHRTARSANPDLRYSETDCMREMRNQYTISTTYGEHVLRQKALEAISALLPRALQLFDSVTGLGTLVELFLLKEQDALRGWDIFNTPQVALAYAFYLAKVGRGIRARSYVSECLKRAHWRLETNERLTELFEDAVSAPLLSQ
jgi:hypothetical protein